MKHAFLALALLLSSAFAQAGDQIICNFGEYGRLAIDPSEKTATIGDGIHLYNVEVDSFTLYRCPGCYGISGEANGESVVAQTRGSFGPNGMEVTADLTKNGVEYKDLFCRIQDN